MLWVAAMTMRPTQAMSAGRRLPPTAVAHVEHEDGRVGLPSGMAVVSIRSVTPTRAEVLVAGDCVGAPGE